MFTLDLLKWLGALLFFRLLFFLFAKDEYQAGKKSLTVVLFLIVWAYLYWMLGSMFQFKSKEVMSILALASSLALLLKSPLKVFQADRRFLEFDLRECAVFWSVLIAALILRSYFPQFDNLEKYTNMAIMQGLYYDTSFPPMDRWLSGYALNYYYFTHILFIPLIQLLNIPLEIAMNLIVSTVAAFLCSGTYELLKFYGSKMYTRFIAIFLLFFAGNWEWVRWITRMRDYKGDFYWFNSSRAIPGAITEFPYFSFLLGDMHAHFVGLLLIPVTVFVWMKSQKYLDQDLKMRSNILLYFVAPLMTGVHYMANSWHVPFVFILLLYAFHKHLKYLLIHLFLAFVYFIYFYALYETPGSTGLFYVEKALRSPWIDFMLHWGPFSFILMVYTAYFLKQKFVVQKWSNKKIDVAILGVLIIFGLLMTWVPAILLAIILFLIRFGFVKDIDQRWDKAILMLSLLTILGCEFISVNSTTKDLRVNTVFKFYYLAWWGLSFSLPILLEKTKIFKQKKWIFCMFFGAILSLYYPVRATAQRIKLSEYKIKTLDGMAYWNKKYPGQRDAIDWLRENTYHEDVIWEVMGGIDHSFARYASFSGRPSVFGWYGHEITWRKNGKDLFVARLSDFIELNKHPDKEEVDVFIRKYNVKWIVFSSKEKEVYSEALKSLLESYPVVFANDAVKIYKAQ